MGYTAQMTSYDFYEDSGHGWLKVDLREIERLGLTTKITYFSYERNGYVFLEEDLDMSTFIDAKKVQDGVDIKLRRHFTNGHSKIRNYKPYVRVGQEA